MKTRFVFIGLLSLLAVSCSLNEMNPLGDEHFASGEEFYVSIDEQPYADTKVYADEDLKVLWNADDLFSLFKKNTFNQEYQFIGEDGSNAGRIIPVGPDGEGDPLDYNYTVYPYDESTGVDVSGTVSLTLPEEQFYKENSFGLGANTMVSVTEDNKLRFKNVGGYLSLKLYGDDVTVSSIVITGNTGERIAGKGTVEMAVGGDPALTMDESAGGKISLVCDPPVRIGATEQDATAFWFVIPPTNFRYGITVSVYCSDGTLFRKTTKTAVTIERSSITRKVPLKVTTSPLVSLEVTEESSSYDLFFDESVTFVEDAFDNPDSYFADGEADGSILIRDFDRLLMSYAHMSEGSTLDYWILDETFKVGDTPYRKAELKTVIPYFFLCMINQSASEDFTLYELEPYKGKDNLNYTVSGPESVPAPTMMLLADESGHLMLYVSALAVFERFLVIPITHEALITKEELSHEVLQDVWDQLASYFTENIQNGVELKDSLAPLLEMQNDLDYSM